MVSVVEHRSLTDVVNLVDSLISRRNRWLLRRGSGIELGAELAVEHTHGLLACHGC